MDRLSVMLLKASLFASVSSIFLGLFSPAFAQESKIIAKYTFDHGDSVESGQYNDTSVKTNWTTTPLIDQATGTGALGASNQAKANRDFIGGATRKFMALSSNRESDTGTPITNPGESTWFTFSIDLGALYSFVGQTASIDTYAVSTLSNTTSANWTLYYSIDGSAYQSLGTYQGKSIVRNGYVTSPKALSWNLSPIGVTSGTVSFILDPVAIGGTNGVVKQRCIGFDQLVVKAVPSS